MDAENLEMLPFRLRFVHDDVIGHDVGMRRLHVRQCPGNTRKWGGFVVCLRFLSEHGSEDGFRVTLVVERGDGKRRERGEAQYRAGQGNADVKRRRPDAQAVVQVGLGHAC